MTSNWSPSLDRGHSSNMVGLDIEGAFDGVWHRARRAAGTDDILLVLLKNYLSERVLMNSKKIYTFCLNRRSTGQHPRTASIFKWSSLCRRLEFLQVTTAKMRPKGSVAERINDKLAGIVAWGRRWQVTVTLNKTLYSCQMNAFSKWTVFHSGSTQVSR